MRRLGHQQRPVRSPPSPGRDGQGNGYKPYVWERGFPQNSPTFPRTLSTTQASLSSLKRSRVFPGDLELLIDGFFCGPSLRPEKQCRFSLSMWPQAVATWGGVPGLPQHKAGVIDSLLTLKKRNSSLNRGLTAKPQASLGVRGMPLGKEGDVGD